jgi:hypothetical protein
MTGSSDSDIFVSVSYAHSDRDCGLIAFHYGRG